MYTYAFWLKGKARAPTVCLDSEHSDCGSGAIGCNPEDLRDCGSKRNGGAASCSDAESTE